LGNAGIPIDYLLSMKGGKAGEIQSQYASDHVQEKLF